MLEGFLVDPVGFETDLLHLLSVEESPHDGVAFRMKFLLYIVHMSPEAPFGPNATMHAIKKQRAIPLKRVWRETFSAHESQLALPHASGAHMACG